ncbi:MAG TPA: PKD domain-containing protein, partial [Candidatus Polarisedimenticolia bacterium]|nr:PKD domain-containing protein [Candidatus Polarisedimenticolia bacterium]
MSAVDGTSSGIGSTRDAIILSWALAWGICGISCQSVLKPEANHPPEATAAATPTTGSAPLTVTFTGSGVDRDGGIAAYAWAFGDGAVSDQQNPTHVYAAGGTYAATLTVTDSDLATGTSVVTITVGAAANRPPVV